MLSSDGSRLIVQPRIISPAPGHEGALLWQWAEPMAVLSSAPVGGGSSTTSWILNIGVTADYERTDLSDHAADVAASLGLSGAGVAFFTAANTSRVTRGEAEQVAAHATVGISTPTWAADHSPSSAPWKPGTINLVVQISEPLSPAAAVNGIISATEAKTQALIEAEVPGTGTASDAVAIVWPVPATGPTHQFAGPRSEIGSQIARASHHAVTVGIEAWTRANRA